MADPTKHLVFSILKFFEEQASSGSLSEDAKESLEVALQCIEAVYETYRHEEAVSRLFPLPEGGLPAVFQAGMGQLVQQKPCISDSEKEAADAQKNAGNELMKAEKYSDALTCYNKAISIDGQNAVYEVTRKVSDAGEVRDGEEEEGPTGVTWIPTDFSVLEGKGEPPEYWVNKGMSDVGEVRDGGEEDPTSATWVPIEVYLWHGTSPTGAKGISADSFKLGLAGSNAGTMCGRGIYLAECSSKSDEHASDDTEGVYKGLFCLLLCRVMLGELLHLTTGGRATHGMIREGINSASYDSVLGDREASSGTYIQNT